MQSHSGEIDAQLPQGKHHEKHDQIDEQVDADQQACQNEDDEDRSRGDGATVHHAGHGDEADVLRERGDRRAAEHAGERANEAIGRHGAGELLVRGVAAQRGGRERRPRSRWRRRGR